MITLFADKLVANMDNRTLSGRLLPFNEPGFTNLGKVTASKDTKLEVADSVILNVEHDRTKPIGKAVTLEPTETGLDAIFSVLATQAGDDALLEASEGLRQGLSIELDNPVIRAGRILSGLVTGAGLVVQPAFESARLAAAEATDAPDMGTGTDQVADPVADPATQDATQELPTVVIDGTELTDVTNVEVSETEISIETSTEDKGEEDMAANATVEPALVAANTAKAVGKRELFARLAENGGRMTAALADIVPANMFMGQPQYVGELWSGKAYERKIVPLFNHADLAGLKVQGWRWVTKPVVGLYAGNKTAVPSAAVSTEQVDVSLQRIAGAHDIDRIYKDFGDTEFYNSYFAAMVESYAKVSDGYVLSEVVGDATAVVPGTVPSGVSTAMSYIVDGALAVLDATDSAPTFAVVANDLWRDLVLTRSEDSLAYLNAALGLEDGTAGNFAIKPSAALADGQVRVGSKDAVTVHELGGEAPIRVQAENIANGGSDAGVFGYVAVNVHDSEGLALVQGNEGMA